MRILSRMPSIESRDTQQTMVDLNSIIDSNARLIEEMRRARERQDRLSKLAAAIGAATALDEILRMVRDGVVSAGGFDRAGIFLYDKGTDTLRGVWGTDRAGNAELISDEIHNLRDSDSLMSDVVHRRLDFALTENFTEKYSPPEGDPMQGVHAQAILPLCAGTELVGVLCVDNLLTDRPITLDDIEGLLPFAAQTAAAIQNARVTAKLQETQDALIKAERLRAVGEMASGVAHNINNVLAAILGYAELIAEDDDASGEIKQYARTIVRAANDGAEIVRRVRQFTKKETQPPHTVFDARAAMQEALDLTRPIWRDRAAARGAHIETKVVEGDPLPIRGVPSEIREVLVNLITNAADAMPHGGTLTLSGEQTGDQVKIMVEDTGVGMSDEILPRIFEPFFTTRGVELGTGLGLSVAWGIAERHKGKIEAYSELGKGSRLVLSLPLCHEPVQNVSASAPISLKGVSILFVEDEEMIAQSLAQSLERHGANVAFAYDGNDALQTLKRRQGKFDVVVSDHGMDGMTGLELLAQVRTQYPTIRRMLLSGWGENVPDGADLSSAERILSKPLPTDKLLTALSELLQSPAK
jgi:signal transduction histidine kinase/CheY-like chemotaxis protein